MDFYFTVVIVAAAFQQQQGIYKRVCESHVIAFQLVSGLVNGQLTLTSRRKTCTCPGDVLMYECTVMSTSIGLTILKGNPAFFDCTGPGGIGNSDDQLGLHHGKFDQGVVEHCNNGAVVGRSLESENGSYTSQFNITVNSEQLLAGGMIECLQDNGCHVSDSVVGAANITVTGACMPRE